MKKYFFLLPLVIIISVWVGCTDKERITDTRTITTIDTLFVSDTLIVIQRDTLFVTDPEMNITVDGQYVSFYLNNYNNLPVNMQLSHISWHVWEPTRDFDNGFDQSVQVYLAPNEMNHFLYTGLFPVGTYIITADFTFFRYGVFTHIYANWHS